MKNTALSAENNSKRSIIFISEAHESSLRTRGRKMDTKISKLNETL